MKDEEFTNRFIETVKDHKLTVMHDDGVYRHLRCAKPGTGIDSFQLVTWPGHLAMCGDRGSFMFHRLTDMFEFFRPKHGRAWHEWIDLCYWAEKCDAANKHCGIEEFNSETAQQMLSEEVREWCDDEGKDFNEIWETIESEIVFVDGQESFYYSISEFNDYNDLGIELDYHDGADYTFHFRWCCHAIRWAIDKYDQAIRRR